MRSKGGRVWLIREFVFPCSMVHYVEESMDQVRRDWRRV
jgi:hypothetical protein